MDIRDVKDLVLDLGWDYDRMSQSGKSLHHLEGLKWIAPKAEVLTDKHAFSEFAQTVNTNLKNIIK